MLDIDHKDNYRLGASSISFRLFQDFGRQTVGNSLRPSIGVLLQANSLCHRISTLSNAATWGVLSFRTKLLLKRVVKSCNTQEKDGWDSKWIRKENGAMNYLPRRPSLFASFAKLLDCSVTRSCETYQFTTWEERALVVAKKKKILGVRWGVIF